MLYRIIIKEVSNQHLLKPAYSSTTEVTEKFLIEFFGLNKPDVEWYKIEKI